MIDYFKAELPGGASAVWENHPALNFFSPLNEQTGEYGSERTAEYRHLQFKIFSSGRATIAGSLHKYWHGEHNGSDFPAWAVQEAICELAHSFGIDPATAQLRALEFGLNVPLPAPATDLLRRAVCYKTLPFDVRTFGGHGYYLQAIAQQYYLKLYDKQRHLASFGLPAAEHLLRAELKASKMMWLRPLRVGVLADLTDPAKLNALGARLDEAFGQVLFGAKDVPASLPPAAQRLLAQGTSPAYWQQLKTQPENFRKTRQRYRALTAQHVPDELAEAAANGIADHWQRLLTPRAVPVLTRSAVPVLTDAPTWSVSTTCPGFNPLCIGVEAEATPTELTVPPVKQCLTCGRDISHQVPSSKYCSEKLYGAAGKRCRNAASNPKHNAKRDIALRLKASALFDQRPYLKLPVKMQMAVCGVFV